MALIYHFIQWLNHLGIKVDTNILSTPHDFIHLAPLFELVDLEKVMNDKNYWIVLKIDLKNKYNEIKNEVASQRVDQLLSIIWEQAGVTVNAEILHPYRNAMIVRVTYEQTLVFEDVIDKLCDQLNKDRQFRSHVCMQYIEDELWPALTVVSVIKHIDTLFLNFCSVENKSPDKLLMKKLAVIVKVAVAKKRKEAGKK